MLSVVGVRVLLGQLEGFIGSRGCLATQALLALDPLDWRAEDSRDNAVTTESRKVCTIIFKDGNQTDCGVGGFGDMVDGSKTKGG